MVKSISDIRTQRTNANRHSPRGMGHLESSVQADGWIGALTVAADGETFDGSARIDVIGSGGFDDPIIVESDGTRPIVHVRTDIPTADDPRAVRLGIAANRVAQVNLDWDADVLAELSADVDLSGFWQPWELNALLGGEDANDPSAEWVGMPEFQQDDQTPAYKCIVNFANEEDKQAFERVVGQAIPRHTKSIWYPKAAFGETRGMGYTTDES